MTPTVQAMQSGVKGFANAVKRLAIKDKGFAEELAFIHNIRSEITPNALKGITKDMFDKGGKMTEKGRKEVASLCEKFGLPQTATWDDLLTAARNAKSQIVKKLNIEGIKFPKVLTKQGVTPLPSDAKMLADSPLEKIWAKCRK